MSEHDEGNKYYLAKDRKYICILEESVRISNDNPPSFKQRVAWCNNAPNMFEI